MNSDKRSGDTGRDKKTDSRREKEKEKRTEITGENGIVERLKACSVFESFDEKDIRALIKYLHPRVSLFKKNENIARDGEMLYEVCIVSKGKVYLSHCDSNGNSNLIEVLGKGGSFGMVNYVGGYKLNIAATATEDVEVVFISVKEFFEKPGDIPCELHIRFLQAVSGDLATKAQYLAKKLEESIRRSTRERLTDYLSHEYHKAGERVFSIPLNRQDLADFLFVDRSALSAELCKMRDEGLLKFDKSKFELLIEMPITEEDP